MPMSGISAGFGCALRAHPRVGVMGFSAWRPACPSTAGCAAGWYAQLRPRLC